MDDFAYVASVHLEPPSKQVSQIVVGVTYGQRDIRLNIRLASPIDVHRPMTKVVAQELRDLGTALLRIADQPSAILDHNPRHS